MKLNKTDYLLLVLFAGFLLLIGVFFFSKPKDLGGKDVLISVLISDDRGIISREAKVGDEIYLNSVNRPVYIEAVDKTDGSVLITVKGKGQIEDQRYIFNGQRLLVNQKTELRGRFFGQGKITEIRYDEKVN